MPYAAPSRCSTPGCNQPTSERGRCEQHQRKAWENPSANARTLTGSQRRHIRDDALTREPVCRQCGRPSVTADHIIPIGEGGAATDPSNLQALCAEHDAAKTASDHDRARRRPRRRG